LAFHWTAFVTPYHLAGNRNAAHPVNAVLNYAYAALESEIRI
jgi:CRISPR/Cas system-associated endonuclease Cas1